MGSVSRYLALLAAGLGWHTRVQGHFDAALTHNRAMRRLPQLARTYCDYAQWLLPQPLAGADERARELAREGTMLADSLRMTWLSERARNVAAA